MRRDEMNEQIEIRAEKEADANGVYLVNQQAFVGDEEADLVDRLHRDGEAMISLVAVVDGQIVGHILFTEVTVVPATSDSVPWTAQGLGPMAVLPDYQRQGIGARLIEAGLDRCRRAGHEVVFVLGHSSYYPRFGFQRAAPLGIRWEGDAPAEAFMVLELRTGALEGRKGTVHFLPQFAGV
jgi:putative acetyltransferase